MRNKIVTILALLMAMPTNIQAVDVDVGGMGDATPWTGANGTDVGEKEATTPVEGTAEITTKVVGVAGASASSSAVMSVAASQLNVTVPMSLPIHLAANGTVTTAEDAKIVNNSIGRVKVTDVDINSANGWSVINYDTDLSTYKVNEKKVGFTLNGIKTGDAGLTFDETKFPSLAGKNDTTSDELKLDYSAVVTSQANALTNEEVANVVFTVDWDSSENVPTGIHMTTQEATAFGYTYELLTDGTYSLTGIPTTVENIEFPAYIDEKAVTELSFRDGGQNNRAWDQYNTILKSVTIPNTVTKIGERAFYNCSSLTSISLPESIASIGILSFASCPLNNLMIPNTVITIGANAFMGIANVTYTGSVTGAPWGALNVNGENVLPLGLNLTTSEATAYGYTFKLNNYFGGVYEINGIPTNIEHIEFPTTIDRKPVTHFSFTYGGASSSASANKTLKSVKFPNGTIYIGNNAFSGCINMSSVYIPPEVVTIDRNAFYNVPHITYAGRATGSPWGAKSIN